MVIFNCNPNWSFRFLNFLPLREALYFTHNITSLNLLRMEGNEADDVLSILWKLVKVIRQFNFSNFSSTGNKLKIGKGLFRLVCVPFFITFYQTILWSARPNFDSTLPLSIRFLGEMELNNFLVNL